MFYVSASVVDEYHGNMALKTDVIVSENNPIHNIWVKFKDKQTAELFAEKCRESGKFITI